MKYIITENRLDKIMTNYLDAFLATKQVYDYDDTVVVADSNADDDENKHWDEYMYYDFNEEELWVNTSFLEEFSSLFGKEEKESIEFIKNWFVNKLGIGEEY